MTSAPTIDFDWRPSIGWCRVRMAAWLLGLACLVWSSLDAWIALALLLAITLVETRARRSERAWKGSRWRISADGVWRWRRADGKEGEAELEQATILGPLIVLNLRTDDGCVDLSLWPDQLPVDTRRQLRVRLPTLRQAHSQSP